MRYSASEKAEIIQLVEQSHLPAKRTLDKPRHPACYVDRWYDRYRTGRARGAECTTVPTGSESEPNSAGRPQRHH